MNTLLLEVIEMLTTLFWTLLLANFSVPLGGFFGSRYVPLYVLIAKMIKDGIEEMKAAKPAPQQQTTDSL